MGQGQAGEPERALDVYRPEVVEGVFVALDEIYLAPDAGVVDEDVKRSEMRQRAV